MLNKVIMIGRVGRDPEVKTLNSGKKVTQLTLATDVGYGDKKRTDWHILDLWEKKAEVVESYVKKGDRISIEGTLKNNNFEKDGVKHYGYTIVVDRLILLEQKQNNNQAGNEVPSYEESNDDLPF